MVWGNINPVNRQREIMPGHIRVLVVEDSENDTLLLLSELKDRNYSPVYRRVETPHAMRQALAEHEWDVVISDYVLPQFSAPESLKVLQESKLDIPFIVVSGIYGEAAAVEMMKTGADDYIVKSNLSRLAPAIEREMDAARSRQIKAKAEAAMHHLAAIVESSDEAIYSKNLDSIIISWNPAAERIFGYCAEEIIGHSIARLFPVKQRDELLDIMAGIRRSEMVGFKETYRKRKDGRVIPVSVTVSPIKDNAGRVIGASTIARDITEKKQTDNERHKLIEELTLALRRVKALSGLLPICTACKSIRDDSGYWQPAEIYIRQHADVTFSQTLCPECEMEHFPESSIRRLR